MVKQTKTSEYVSSININLKKDNGIVDMHFCQREYKNYCKKFKETLENTIDSKRALIEMLIRYRNSKSTEYFTEIEAINKILHDLEFKDRIKVIKQFEKEYFKNYPYEYWETDKTVMKTVMETLKLEYS